jgi:hypothetical protein
MDCTTVPNAGKLATSESLTMTAHLDGVARIECKLDGDPRLIAGAAAIAAHVARRAGLAEAAASELAVAAADACDAAQREFGNSRAAIRFAAGDYPDRVEVTIELQPAAEVAGRGMRGSGGLAETAENIRQRLKSAAVDSVNVEFFDGTTRVTLVKNRGAAKRRFVV